MRKINFQILKKRVNYSNCLYTAFLICIILFTFSCKKELNQINPNAPTLAGNVNSEAGIAEYALGGVYWNGFNYGDGWLGNSYFSLPWGYHELTGDVVGGGAGSNNQTTTLGVPESFTPDPVNAAGTVVANVSPQITIIRSFNNTASTQIGNNVLYYEWTNMYSMINAMNITLGQLGSITGLSADKMTTIKAWCAWWKGYAYAQIGTLYYAGLIVDTSATTNNNYIGQAAIIDESNKQLNNAITALKSISNSGDYTTMITELIPQQNQVDLGMPPSPAQWIKSINTLLARNIVLNHLAPFVNSNPSASITGASVAAMSANDWASVIAYCNTGIQEGDYVFTGRTSATNSYFTAPSGSVAALCSISDKNSTYKLSERLVQNFQTGDKRLANFSTVYGTFYGDANTNSTRYTLVDGVDSVALTGIPVLGTRSVGNLEIYIGPTYEENELMLAEADIRTGKISQGLALIDAVRTYQGAGLPAVAGSSLTLAQALDVLTKERLAALAFRGLSEYDLRRWGWSYGKTKGGGRYGCTLIYNNKVYTNSFINYNYMDYWDVPDDEISKNPPTDGGAAVVNPNY